MAINLVLRATSLSLSGQSVAVGWLGGRDKLSTLVLWMAKLTGMIYSYRPIIWKTVRMNPKLTTLEPEMSVGLDIKSQLV
ncbi:hypothetical protein N7449_001369 [Penicillium cf. viridicatum]|uniref:Uncharacterized protein n=1 Tax=Penicillium cf. viridicatum TaxID=2972119 RepID=A0A9W9N6P8_9EURO|nr:hypothetical protein N7449_001369 [Penicillium cf. viridicatum]